MLAVLACFSLLFLNPDHKLIVKINNLFFSSRWSVVSPEPAWGETRHVRGHRQASTAPTNISQRSEGLQPLLNLPQPVSDSLANAGFVRGLAAALESEKPTLVPL